MRDYIILNNKNSNEIQGLLIQNLPPITKSRIRAEIEEIDGKDGDIVTPLGYGAYDKVFSIGLYGNFDINEVIKYFDSEGIVVFSNEPNKYYKYKILEQIDFEKLIRFRTADVMMHVQPFKYSTTEQEITEEMQTKSASGSEIDLPDTNNEKLQMEKLKGDTHQDTIDAEEGNENEDTNLAVNDVDPSKENYITLKGNTTQYNHDSVNMLPNDMATLSLYGITITKNDDGTYTINGTTTQDFNWAINDTALNLQANTNYFLSGCATGGDAETYCLYISAYADTGNGVLINSSRAINDQVRIFIASGQTFNNTIFKPMLIEGTEAIPFEPYGMTTPSPQYPSEVKVVKGENVVSVQGKNLLNMNYLVEANADKTYAPQGFWAFKISDKIGTYTLSRENANMVSGGSYIAWGEGNDITTAYNRKTWIAHQSNASLNYQSQVKNNSGELWIFLSTNESKIQNIPNDYGYLMLEQNSQATPYAPYSKTDYPISLGTLELCKIGDYKDYLFKRNGKWYVHKEIGKVVLDDSNIDLVVQYGTEYDYPRVLIEKVKLGWKVSWTQHIALLNSYQEITKVNQVQSGKFSGNFSSTSLTIWNSDFTSLEVARNLLKGTIIYIVLATPTEEEITDTSLISQLDALHTAELQETSYINSTPAKEYPYINLKYNVVTPAPSPDRASEINKVTGNNTIKISNEDGTLEANYPINLGNLELCKIGNYQDYLYKNNGKWYVHKEIGKIILDGSERWSSDASWNYTNTNNYRTNIGSIVNTTTYANHFNYLANAYSVDAEGVMQTLYGTNIMVRINNTIAPTIEDFKTWLSTHNTIVYYVLATPTEEEITDETLLAQLEALDNIYNQKGTTYIKTNPEGNNMPLDLDVSYTESRPITITNSGNIYSKPIFTIYGEGNIGVYLNDIQLFSINLGSEEQITIDVAEMQAYNKETKALKNRLVTGSYDKFLLKVGENKISFSGIVKKFEIENYSRWI